MNNNYYIGVGRDKEATARVHLKKGSGENQVRTKKGTKTLPNYFYMDPSLCEHVYQPLKLFNEEKSYDLVIRVRGGGFRSQADSIKLGTAKALLKIKPEYKITLRSFGLLTSDSRRVEKKKVGHKKARKKPQ